MKLHALMFALMLTLGAAAPVPAQEETPPPAEKKKERKADPRKDAPVPVKPTTAEASDSPLVAAAKRAKGGKIKPGLTVTNDNLKDIKGVGGSVVYAKPADPGAPAYNPDASDADASGRSKADWQALVAEARRQVASLEASVSDLQSTVAKLESDYYAWDDPAYRDGVIKPALDQARADLQAARQALPAARQRISDLEEEARKSGTPPGWLR